MIPFQLSDLLVVELVADDGVASHFSHQEHHSFHLRVDFLVDLYEPEFDLLLYLVDCFIELLFVVP